MAQNIWVDTIERVGRGCKRHVYEATHSTKQDRGGGSMGRRKCGTSDDNTGNHGMAPLSKLERMDATEYAVSANACLTCVKALGLERYREMNMNRGQGAENVDFDPFGVFEEDD